jgi:hypothetical protein
MDWCPVGTAHFHQFAFPRVWKHLRSAFPWLSIALARQLSCIENSAFQEFSSLSSICIAASVDRLCQQCFRDCSALSVVTFESDSKLSWLESLAFWHCSSLSSICIAASVDAPIVSVTVALFHASSSQQIRSFHVLNATRLAMFIPEEFIARDSQASGRAFGGRDWNRVGQGSCVSSAGR